jgi:hypothetical protein
MIIIFDNRPFLFDKEYNHYEKVVLLLIPTKNPEPINKVGVIFWN